MVYVVASSGGDLAFPSQRCTHFKQRSAKFISFQANFGVLVLELFFCKVADILSADLFL
jgi:hypothetical protein